MGKKLKAAVSHHEREVVELSADRELAVAYLRAALESIDDPDHRAGALLALRTVAEAYGGLDATPSTPARRVGFLAGRIRVPDDFDQMGRAHIEELFSGQK